ncbi:MAG: DUF72 domain-containing protein [Chitinophagaceae bacterium]|nr:MAG: DUF72 domain-containing protein [Chitinophagaceae bacterium]
MAKAKAGNIFIGTSNVVLPGNKTLFPSEHQDKSRLQYYALLFNSVEINSSFYKVPLPKTFEKWAADVPPGFQFSIKVPKTVTHAKELRYNPADLDYFLTAAERAGIKKGPLLIQFPGKITVDYYGQVETILEQVRRQSADVHCKMAVEFRHSSWYVGETMELLDEYEASLVIHDMPKSKPPDINRKAPFVFLRMHGPAGDYRGSYGDEVLEKYAKQIRSYVKKGKDVYCYFNNTIGAAFDNARALQALLK